MRLNRGMSLLPAALLALVWASGCKTTTVQSTVETWPLVDATPRNAPDDLELDAPASVLRQGSDGFLYIVGGLPDDVEPGARFIARYAGAWPLQDLPRPPLVSGWLVRRLRDDAALVTLEYALPDVQIEGLEVTWPSADNDESLGKGVAVVTALRPTETSDVELSAEESLGVQRGDIYAILAPAPTDASPQQLQLARRLRGVCLVDDVQEAGATCRLWRGSSMVAGIPQPQVGDAAVFLEHTYGLAPRPGVIRVAKVSGDKDGAATKLLFDAMSQYVDSIRLPFATVEMLDSATDAAVDDFHRAERLVEQRGMPQMLLAGSLVAGDDGVPHLVVNYTGVGPASGPGMVAAPPERGVDLGPLGALQVTDLRGLAGVVWGGLLVYRGQTSEALMHLHLVLSDPFIRGPLRWHARDQYAMRWGALGRLEQALWLVLEDEMVARRDKDRRAELNALGTRVRLYDMLGQPERALALAREYLEARPPRTEEDSAYLSALGMHAEMLLSAGQIEPAKKAVAELRSRCPEGCGGDLGIMLSGLYWSVPDGAEAFQDELLTEIVDLAAKADGGRMASARVYQGLAALREEKLEDALIAFLEAERLYDAQKNLPGLARTSYFIFLTQLSRREPQKAFENAVQALRRDREIGDFDSATRTYERLSGLYTNLDADTRPGPYLGAGRDILRATVEAHLAQGNYSKASEALFALGVFLVRLGVMAEGQNALQRGVLFAIRSTRFDMAAMSHLWLGVVARSQNDRETFVDEINRARIMAEISEDPEVLEAIERLTNPEPQQPDVPTQVL